VSSDRLGIIAGNGRFPVMVAEAARQKGMKVTAAGFQGMVDQALADKVDELRLFPFCLVGEILEFLKSKNIKKAITIGTIPPSLIHETNLKMDELASMMWDKMKDRRTDTMMYLVVEILAEHGIEVLDSTIYLKELLAPQGLMAGKQPDHAQWADIRLGFKIAKAIGALDIGQTVIIKNRSIIAVEAIEGTDNAILRTKNLAPKGAVVVKVAKPQQDFRFDVPAVGVATLQAMTKTGAQILAVEEGKVLIDNNPDMIKKAARYGITFIGVSQKQVKE